jgi:hypothetical protein
MCRSKQSVVGFPKKGKDSIFGEPPHATRDKPWGIVQHFNVWSFTDGGGGYFGKMRAMQAAEMVEKNDKSWYLPADGLLALSWRAAKPIAEKIIGRIDAGEWPSAAEIKEEIEDAKWAVKREPHNQRSAANANSSGPQMNNGNGVERQRSRNTMRLPPRR